ncbi:MAG: alpha/beta fold hydrolase [Candidatus Micrarchaeota archaeon]
MALKYKSKNKPYRTGYFLVGQGHELYYELVGNPNGIPVVHLHGGPGAGFQQKDRDYYNPKKFNALLFDQRGSNHSKPLAETKNNTTQLLVKDIEKLMDFVGFQKAIIVGGSWGSTLALVFAIQHPKRVSALLIRGIYLANRFSRNHFYFGGVQSFFPDVHEKFLLCCTIILGWVGITPK